jgi:sugar phosphate isomerase/epimerase
MRKYSASTLPFTAFALDQFLRNLADNGISAVELAKAHFDGLDAQAAKVLQEETGVRFKSLLSTVNIATPNGLDEMVAVLDIAKGLAISMVSVSSGGREEVTEAEIDTIIDRLATLTETAAHRNITLAFYAHEGSMAYSLERTQRIFDAISSDYLGFYYSPYHFHRAGDDPVAALENLAARLCNVYFNCGVDPATGKQPFWGPEMDLSAICAAIQQAGYSEEIMLIYLGLKAETPRPITEGIVHARSLLEVCFR